MANGCNSRFYNISCFSTAEKYIKKKCEKQIGTGGGQLGNSLHAKIHSYRVGDADNNEKTDREQVRLRDTKYLANSHREQGSSQGKGGGSSG